MRSNQLISLRRALQFPLCATITLLAGVVENPTNLHSPSDVNAIGSFVRFLEKMHKQEGCDLGRFLEGCTVFEDIAKTAVVEAHKVFQDPRGVVAGSPRFEEPSGCVAIEAIQASHSVKRAQCHADQIAGS